VGTNAHDALELAAPETEISANARRSVRRRRCGTAG
jgi:hypothetical protein